MITALNFSSLNTVPASRTDAASAYSPPNSGKTVPSAQTTEATTSNNSTNTAASPLSAEELSEIASLKATDSQVRKHEAAHLAAASGLARGGASYEYSTGPDGVRYAVGGEVSIDTSEAHTPEQTLLKAGQIRRAALAPADPSAQDLSVAATAAQMAMQASAEIAVLSAQKTQAAKEAEAQSANEAYGSAANNFPGTSSGQQISIEA